MNFTEISDLTAFNTNFYKSSYETFNAIYNSTETSFKEYYRLNSNGKLTVNSPIFTDDNTNVKVFTTDKPRTYYLPYVIYKNGSYQINTNGYFYYFVAS